MFADEGVQTHLAHFLILQMYLVDVTIMTGMTNFYYFTRFTNTGVMVTHSFIFLPAFGPICPVDSCAARCCDSELRLTVHCCAL